MSDVKLIEDLRIWIAMAAVFIEKIEPRDAREADHQAGLLNSLGSLGVHKLSVAPPTADEPCEKFLSGDPDYPQVCARCGYEEQGH